MQKSGERNEDLADLGDAPAIGRRAVLGRTTGAAATLVTVLLLPTGTASASVAGGSGTVPPSDPDESLSAALGSASTGDGQSQVFYAF